MIEHAAIKDYVSIGHTAKIGGDQKDEAKVVKASADKADSIGGEMVPHIRIEEELGEAGRYCSTIF